MITSSFYSAFLYLDNGLVYKGWSLFKNHISYGELVFNTGMTGYQEIITDPSYSNQIVIFTHPELGNTGLNQQDNESNLVHVKGIISKNLCLYPSSWRNRITLKDFIVNKRIPHIFGIDTRSLTRYLRNQGVMVAYISFQLIDKSIIKSYKNVLKLDLVQRVTKLKALFFTKMNVLNNCLLNYLDDNEKSLKQKKILNLVLIDFGVKNNIIMRLLAYNCNIYVLPATTNYFIISKYKPDAILLSNGPGDPSLVNYAVQTIKKLIYFSNIPIFGICMGHQLLNLALGGSTFKLKFGHRGLNHPSGINQFSEITSQNHGFAVELSNFNKKNIEVQSVTHLNLNDYTIAGVIHNDKPVFSVQHHPEASPGPHDSDYLFKFFIKLIQRLKFNN